MGFLKKITRPISRFLDKIVPNELKPALPYLSAFAPYLLPGGIAGGSGIGALLRRGAMTGGINLASQLAQEGSEGEFSGLSALLAAGQGALTAPDASATLGGMRFGDPTLAGPEYWKTPMEELSFLEKMANKGITGLQGASKFLTGAGETIRDPSQWGLDPETLAAFGTPITHGTADLAMITARQALDDFEDEVDVDDPLYSDDGRRRAIRAAMEAAGHLEDTILDALGSLGLKEGGRVGAMGGGIMHAKRGLVDAPGGYAGDKEEIDFGGITEAVTAVEKTPKKFLVDKLEVTVMPGQSEMMAIINAMMNDTDGVMPDDRKQEFYRLYLPQLRASGEISETEYNGLMGELFNKANGGRISKEGGGVASVLPKGKEADYRGGGVIPVGSKERADDVPARLSKNEFVMTADAVRAAGGGNINQGAKRMYNLMNNLEARV